MSFPAGEAKPKPESGGQGKSGGVGGGVAGGVESARPRTSGSPRKRRRSPEGRRPNTEQGGGSPGHEKSQDARAEGSPGRPNTAPAPGLAGGHPDSGQEGAAADGLGCIRPTTTWTSAVRAALVDLRMGQSYRMNDGSAALVKEYWRTPPAPRSGDSDDKPDSFTGMKLRDIGVGDNGRNKGMGIGPRFLQRQSYWERISPGPGEYEATPMTELQPSCKYHNQPSFTMGALLPGLGGARKRPGSPSGAPELQRPRAGSESLQTPVLVVLGGGSGEGALEGTLGSTLSRASTAPPGPRSQRRRPVGGKRQQHGYH